MDKTFKKLPDKRQEEILYAAAEIFAENGYWRANINSICDKAGISNGALYRYFKNKETLYIYVFNHAVKLMQAVYDQSGNSEGSVFDQIRQMLVNTVKYHQDYPAYFELYADIWSGSMNEMTAKVNMSQEKEIDNFWIELAEAAAGRGEIKAGVSPRYAAYLIDSQTLLFFFAMTSTYHQKRFNVFLVEAGENLSNDELIDKVVENLKLCLAP